MISGSPNSTARGTAARIDWYAFGVTAAKGMAARYLDISLTAGLRPVQVGSSAAARLLYSLRLKSAVLQPR
jgi:hypothetical protein